MKKISQIETGGRFLYGGVEWVKLYAGDGTVAISAEPKVLPKSRTFSFDP